EGFQLIDCGHQVAAFKGRTSGFQRRDEGLPGALPQSGIVHEPDQSFDRLARGLWETDNEYLVISVGRRSRKGHLAFVVEPKVKMHIHQAGIIDSYLSSAVKDKELDVSANKPRV